MRIYFKLAQQLDKQNLSQHEISRLTGIRQASINEMCQNKTKRIPIENLAKLCETLDCEINDILELRKEPTE